MSKENYSNMKKIQWKFIAYDVYNKEKEVYVHAVEITIPDAKSEKIATEKAKELVKRKNYTLRGAFLYQDDSEEKGKMIGVAMKEAMKDNED